MAHVVIFISFAIAIILQSSIVAQLFAIGLRPDFVLLGIVGLGLVGRVRRALFWTLIAGTLLDLVSGGIMGVTILALAPVALLTWFHELRVVESSLLLAVIIALVGTFLYNSVLFLLFWLMGSQADWVSSLMTSFVPSAIANTLLMPVAFWVFRWLGERLELSVQPA